MSATSMATARFMETWAHGRDVAAALGVELPADDRVRHVVHLGVRTRGFAYAQPRPASRPAEESGSSLTLPSGARGRATARPTPRSAVTGSAHDFALLVTQRLHRDDADLVAVGDGRRRVARPRAGLRRPARDRDGSRRRG